jgi:hypothetical protein
MINIQHKTGSLNMSERVLLITPRFYGVEKIIKSVLEESGYAVIWIENKTLLFDFHGTNSKFKFLRRTYSLLFSPLKRYVRKELKKIEDLKFDIILAINAHIICTFIFRKLKCINPELFSVLYLWDSFSMYNWTKELRLFDRVYTFDPKDSINYRLNYKPNFYITNSTVKNPDNDYDLFFVGKFSPERLTIIDKIETLPEISGIKRYVKLWPAYKILFHNHLIYNILKWFIPENTWTKNYLINYEAFEGMIKREFIVSESIDFKDSHNYFLSSNVILDLPYRHQAGYTHRLIEALATGKKIITTNSFIQEEKFYNSDQIKIIDELNPEIDLNWVKMGVTFPVDKCFLDLELSKWLKSIINVGIA